jgi:hypothetical protein
LKKSITYILLVLISIFGYSNSYGQTLEDIKKEADALFEKGEFLQAKKGFSKVISSQNYKLNPDVNFKYGTCLLYSKGDDKKKAIAHLSFAVKKPGIDSRAFYYLGKAYHLNYQFDLALKYYKKFKELASPSQIKKFNVDADIKACKYGKKLLTNITDIIVIEKTEIKKQDFYELYKLNDFGGNIIVTDQFQSKYDKKVGYRPVIHFPQNSPYIYYSSYGKDGSTGLDIYVQKKLPNGQWALPQKIQGGVNTNLDENYPYMSPNGQYLYFSSKGHNSMGGYDVFRSKYNPDNNTFSAPENMDFAISSPDDDIFYVVDSLDRMAYFSSARESQQDKIMVYKVRVEKIPMQFAVIKGSFIDEIDPSNHLVEFIINDFNNGAEIGTFKSKANDGDFLITFPKSGKYTFTITVDGREVSHQAVVDIPYLKEFRPLKMKITHFNDPVNGETIKVEPLFDERFENPTEILAQVYKEMAELNPNADKFNLDSLDKLHETDKIFVDAGLDPYSTKEDVEKVVQDRVNDLENQIDENRKNTNIAFHLAEENNQKAEELINEAEKLVVQAENSTDSNTKNELLQEAFIKNEQAKKLHLESKKYVDLGEKIQTETVKLNQELIQSKQTLVDVKSIPSGDRMALTKMVDENKTYFENQVKNVDNTSVIEKIKKEGNTTQKEYSKINEELVQLNNRKLQLEKQNENLKIDYQNAKKKKEKDRLEKIINSNESELDVINQTIVQKEKQLNELSKTNNSSTLLVDQANKVQNPSYDNVNYTKDLTNTEINSIKNKSNSTEIESTFTKIDDVLSENNVKGRYVSITGLDESRKDLTVNEWETAYDTEINAQKNRLNQTTDPTEKEKIQGEIVRLEKAKQDKIKGSAVTQNSNNTVSEYELIDDYATKIEKINSITDENERRIKENELNEEIKNKVDYERIQTQKLLDENPSDVALKNKIKQLDALYEKATSNINENNEYLNSTSNSANSNANNNVFESAYPNYGKKVDDIYASNLSSTEKQEKIQELNQSTLNSIDEKIQETQAVLENDPNNEKTQNEINELNRIKKEIENNPTQAVIEPNTIKDITTVKSKVTKDDIFPTYASQLENINNSNKSELDKAIEKQDLNKILLKKTNKQIQEIENELKNNPDNKKTLEKRLTNLNSLKSNLETEINQNQIFIDENLPTDNTSIVSIESINPNYVPNMLEIENIDDQTEKNNAITSLNQETIAIIDTKINEIGDDANRQAEKEDLIKLKRNIETHIDQANDANELNRRYGNISAKVTAKDAHNTYDSELASIENSSDNEAAKAQRKIDLNNVLISKIDRELAGLNTYLNTNPTNKKEIEKRIVNLEKLKADKQAENQTYQQVVDKDVQVVSITVDDLMRDYDDRKNQIDNSNQTAGEKIKAKNELDNDLINKIDLKIDELERIKLSQPDKFEEIEEQISKLNELKEVKQNEIAHNNEILASVNSNDVSTVDKVTELNENNFVTEKGKATYIFIKPELEKVENLDAEISNLKTQKANVTSEKEINKINKQIIKKETEKAKIENQIIEDLDEANQAEVNQKQNNNTTSAVKAKSFGENSTELNRANEMTKTANRKIKEAQELRTEAKSEKDPILVNNKLKRALILEEEAKVLYDNANQTYKTEIVVNEITSSTPDVIIEVPENESERKSTQMFNQANELDKQANYYEQRSMELKDSAETVKKKYKQAILIQAQEFENKANDTRVKSTELKQKATSVKAQEDEIISTVPSKEIKAINEEEKTELATTKTYKFYYGVIKEGDENMAKAKEIEQQIEEKKKQSKRIIKQAIVVNPDGSIVDTNPEITKLQAEIEALKQQQEEYKNKALQNYADANRTLENSDLTDNSKANILAMANSNEQPIDKVEVVDVKKADFIPPTQLNQDIFRTTDVPVYNTLKDIPVDTQQPEGLVYKVQIGAFRNEPRKEYFDKFAPISGQTLNNGITRYMVGYFTSFNHANTAKTQVRGMGDYKDAFVVAYYNGKRISMAKAKEIEAVGEVNDNNQFVINDNNVDTNNQTNNNSNIDNNTIENNNTTNNITNDTNTNNTNNQTTENTTVETPNITVTPTTNEEKQLASYYTNNSNVAPANQVEIMKGVFFTVQIGVYSKPVPLSVLFNTQPLNSQLTDNGKIRYTTGIYNSIADANVRKQEMINKGIQDAFVTAYYNGKRITIAEARQILDQQGEKVLFTNGGQGTISNFTDENTTIENNQASNNTQNDNEDNNSNANQNITNDEKDTNKNQSTEIINYDPSKIHYKVLIGVFEDKVPTEYNKYIFNDNGVSYEPKIIGNKIYLLSSELNSIGEIKEVITELDELGLENMEIVTYYDDKVIPFNEGEEIKNKSINGDLTIYDYPKGTAADEMFYNPEAVYYRIIDVFEGDVPTELANKILFYDENEYTKDIDIDGNTIFESKKYMTYNQAKQALDKYKADGFVNAEIKAYHKYREISIEKAKAIKGE